MSQEILQISLMGFVPPANPILNSWNKSESCRWTWNIEIKLECILFAFSDDLGNFESYDNIHISGDDGVGFHFHFMNENFSCFLFIFSLLKSLPLKSLTSSFLIHQNYWISFMSGAVLIEAGWWMIKLIIKNRNN